MLLLLVAVLALQAQDEVRVSSRDYIPTLRVDTRLVEIAAVVRDGHGKVVTGLSKDNFRILDEGKPRVVDHFAIEKEPDEVLTGQKGASGAVKAASAQTPTDQPRFLALYIDDVNATDGSLANGLKTTQAAAKKFVKDALKADVHIGLFTASGAQTLEFTTDEAKLVEAISEVKAHVKVSENGLTYCPRITPYQSYRISSEKDQNVIRGVQFDAGEKGCQVPMAVLVAQADETWRRVQEVSTDTLNSIGRVVVHLGTMPGRRELLLASSGFLGVSLQPLKDKVVERALQAGVVINALDAKGIYGEAAPGMRPEDHGFTQTVSGMTPYNNAWVKSETVETALRLEIMSEPLGSLADGTGGKFYHYNNDLLAGFRKLGNPPEVIYRLGFRPDGVAPDGSFHKLKVSVINTKDSVQARPGYFAPDERASQSLQAKVDREILADDTLTGFQVDLTARPDKKALSVVMNVDISKLRFAKKEDRQINRVAFTVALIDAQGRIAAAKEGQIDLSLTEAGYTRLLASGVNAKITLEAPPGAYRLRQVSVEAVDTKMACSSQSVKVE